MKALFQNVRGTCWRPGLSPLMPAAPPFPQRWGSPRDGAWPADLRVSIGDLNHNVCGRLHRVVADVIVFQILPKLGEEQRVVLLWREHAFHHRLGAGQGGEDLTHAQDRPALGQSSQQSPGRL